MKLITSALPYVNNSPHLGNIIGSVLSADIYNRYCKLVINEKTLFVCGTDEHGTTTEVEAQKRGVSCEDLCNEYYNIHRKVYDFFNIEFDIFGRTSDKDHKLYSQEVFTELFNSGIVSPEITKEFFCNKCLKAVADRYVKGECYNCNSSTKGDQCDNCNELIENTKLLNPKCSVCKNDLILKDNNHCYLRLTKFKKELEDQDIELDKNGSAIKKIFLDTLKDRCITRQINYGIDVPIKDFEDKKIYVWFEAPIAYFSFAKRKMELTDCNVEFIQFMGKDNVPFHTIVFPAIILGLNKLNKNKLPIVNKISSTEYLLWDNKKFSKSECIGMSGLDAIEFCKKEEINSDYLRFYLCKIRPENADSSFSLEKFRSTCNSDLLNNFGNLINRILKLSIKHFNQDKININLNEFRKLNYKYFKDNQDLNTLNIKFLNLLDKIELKEGLRICLSMFDKLNRFLQDKAVWKHKGEEFYERNSEVLKFVLIWTWKTTQLMEIFTPITCKKVLNSIQLLTNKQSDYIKIKDLDPIFKKL